MSQNPYFFNPGRQKWYYATSQLGRGGQGIVWSGYSEALPVAIKVQTDFASWDREQRILLACIHHPHIVQSYDQFIMPDGSHVLVMEKAECSAQNLVDRENRYSPTQVCTIGAQLASALEWIHSKGIRHRDITLRNVLHFGRDRFKLSDFGIARMHMATDDLALTQIGTPGWFPPEVLKGDGSSTSSDVYQLGLVLLSLLLGRHIFPPGYTREQLRAGIMSGAPRQTAEQLRATYGETAWIIRNMLPRTPELRHESATDVRLAFEAELNRLKAPLRVNNLTHAFPKTAAMQRPAASINRPSLAIPPNPSPIIARPALQRPGRPLSALASPPKLSLKPVKEASRQGLINSLLAKPTPPANKVSSAVQARQGLINSLLARETPAEHRHSALANVAAAVSRGVPNADYYKGLVDAFAKAAQPHSAKAVAQKNDVNLADLYRDAFNAYLKPGSLKS